MPLLLSKNLTSLASLLFPLSCISCGLSGTSHCRSCQDPWLQPHFAHLDNLPLMWMTRYSSATAHIILAAKEDNDRTAQLILAQSLDRGLSHAISKGLCANRELLLVPIPSAKSASRKRGHFHLRTVAKAMQGDFQFLELLEPARRLQDQSNLDRDQRLRNSSGAYRVKVRYSSDPTWISRIENRHVILFDDLITTGSSLREAVRALKVAKISPELALSACAVRAR